MFLRRTWPHHCPGTKCPRVQDSEELGRLSPLPVCLLSVTLALRPRVREAVPSSLIFPEARASTWWCPTIDHGSPARMHNERHLPVWLAVLGPASSPGRTQEPVAWPPLVRDLVSRGAHNTPGHPRRMLVWDACRGTSIWAVCLA